MKHTIIPITMLFLAFTACKDAKQHDHKTQDQPSPSSSEQTQPAQSTGAPQLKNSELASVYQHYVHLTNALVNEDAAEAKTAAAAIEEGAKNIKNGGQIASASSKIVDAANIEEQRTAYSQLSNELISQVRSSGMSSGEVYVDYCPMAMDDKGAYWLSSKKEIRNPYFGDKMLTCGEVKETIK